MYDAAMIWNCLTLLWPWNTVKVIECGGGGVFFLASMDFQENVWPFIPCLCFVFFIFFKWKLAATH